jgi:Histidine kinase-, DNA gyrase B-, and HSP90-like ATPase
MNRAVESIETLEVIPNPVSLIESMRAVGYSVEAAIADIIDNSLSASAKTIQVRYDASESAFVAVLDDGIGMDASELTDAMRHGSTNPAKERAGTDLGRFGLGLKTASLSQCRKLTVISKRKNGQISARRWDIDVVQQTGKWLVVVPNAGDLAQLPMYGKLEAQTSGTLVVWQELDRLTAGSLNAQLEMTAKMAPLFEHLALVFHRFTRKEGDYPSIAITVNGLRLPARDPFLGGNPLRQELEGQTIYHERGTVSIQPYVLPPVSNLSPQEIEIAGGREGLRGTQGFYVYRNRRLVIWGTWFRLVPKQESYKLTRIRVDIPNSFDDLWALDIKKSVAYPPDPIRTRLKNLIPHFANTSKRALTYKGRLSNAKGYVPLWNRLEVEPGRFSYTPNLDHPLIENYSKTLNSSEQHSFQMILKFLAVGLPYDGIYADMCGDTRGQDQNELLRELVEMAVTLRDVVALDIKRILEIDPLCRHPELHQAIIKEMEK